MSDMGIRRSEWIDVYLLELRSLLAGRRTGSRAREKAEVRGSVIGLTTTEALASGNAPA